MIKSFPISFVQVALEQTLQKLHNDNPNLVGGKNQIEIHSFYEQLKTQDEVDRFVETFRDLTEQQNRSGLIANGILMSPENPTITNLYTSMIIPMTWACSLRVKLSDRDLMLETINALIDELKGSKVDIAELKCRDDQGRAIYVPFAVGTIGHIDGTPYIKCGDYIGDFASSTPTNNDIKTRLSSLGAIGLGTNLTNNEYLYLGANGEIKVAQVTKGISNIQGTIPTPYPDITTSGSDDIILTFTSTNSFDSVPDISTVKFHFYLTDGYDQEDKEIVPTSYQASIVNGKLQIRATFLNLLSNFETSFIATDVLISTITTTITSIDEYKLVASSEYDIIFPPEHESFEKYKLSLSFEGLRCDTPRTLNGDEYCEISFGGSATLVNNGVKLGNDLVKLSVVKSKIMAESPITFTSAPVYWLEPLELPSGNGANTIPNQLVSNAFKVNTHTDSLTLTLQYTFILDNDQTFLNQLYKYGRYGTQGITVNDISPNMIYNIDEWWSSWGVVDKETFKAKLIESVDIENTESDTMTISITMQIQGDNN